MTKRSKMQSAVSDTDLLTQKDKLYWSVCEVFRKSEKVHVETIYTGVSEDYFITIGSYRYRVRFGLSGVNFIEVNGTIVAEYNDPVVRHQHEDELTTELFSLIDRHKSKRDNLAKNIMEEYRKSEEA